MTGRTFSSLDAAGGDPHRQIGDLYGRYVHSLRRDDADALVDCFHTDAAFLLGELRVEGRAQIVELLMKMSRNRPRHHTSDLWISSLEGDQARCLAHLLLLDANSGITLGFGFYDDLVVRCPDARWRWRDRRVQLDWTADAYRERAAAQSRTA